jgi:enoyl-CoA hydratase/carnithine racemase
MTAELHTSRTESTLIITISGAETRNAVHPDMVGAAIEILSTGERDDTIRAIILTGAGSYFSSGTDLHHLLEIRAQEKSIQIDSVVSLQTWIETIRNCTKPIIAAVEGEVAGSALSLALACDLIVAGASTQFLASNARVGLAPDGGTSWLMSQSMPRQLATEMLLTSEAVDATRMHSLGLVNRIVADGTALDAALALADRLAELAPKVTIDIKSLMIEMEDSSMAQHFESEKYRFIESLQHRNAQEGISAFLAKRKPQFK